MAQVGLTTGGFYRHFDSKEPLLKEACAEAFAHSGLARQPGNSPALKSRPCVFESCGMFTPPRHHLLEVCLGNNYRIEPL
jgi:hypothetical protein